jgi:hypothetical protein
MILSIWYLVISPSGICQNFRSRLRRYLVVTQENVEISTSSVWIETISGHDSGRGWMPPYWRDNQYCQKESMPKFAERMEWVRLDSWRRWECQWKDRVRLHQKESLLRVDYMNWLSGNRTKFRTSAHQREHILTSLSYMSRYTANDSGIALSHCANSDHSQILTPELWKTWWNRHPSRICFDRLCLSESIQAIVNCTRLDARLGKARVEALGEGDAALIKSKNVSELFHSVHTALIGTSSLWTRALICISLAKLTLHALQFTTQLVNWPKASMWTI